MARAKKKAAMPRTRSPKAPRPQREVVMSPQAKRRQKSASAVVRKGTTISQVQPGHGEIGQALKRGRRPY